MSKFKFARSVPYDTLNIAQAAQATGLDRKVIQHAVDSGQLTSHTRLQRVTLIAAEALEAWFNGRGEQVGE